MKQTDRRSSHSFSNKRFNTDNRRALHNRTSTSTQIVDILHERRSTYRDRAGSTFYRDEIDGDQRRFTNFRDDRELGRSTNFRDDRELGGSTNFRDDRELGRSTNFRNDRKLGRSTNFRDDRELGRSTIDLDGRDRGKSNYDRDDRQCGRARDRSENARSGFPRKNHINRSRYSPYDRRNKTHNQSRRRCNSINNIHDQEYDRDPSPILSDNSNFVQVDCWMAESSEEENGSRYDSERGSNSFKTEEIGQNLKKKNDSSAWTINKNGDWIYSRNDGESSSTGTFNGLRNKHVHINRSHDQASLEYLNSKEYEPRERCLDHVEMIQGENERQRNIHTIEDVVSYVLDLVLQNGGEVSLLELEKEIQTKVSNDNLKSFLTKFPKVFEIDIDTEEEGFVAEKEEIVRARTEVKLCEVHCKQPGYCHGGCNSLHICRFFILSSCNMTRCKFGHELNNEHNMEVLQKFYLHQLDFHHLRLLLRHDGNRCSVTIPIICQFYNGKGCSKGIKTGSVDQKQKCPFLHICQNFVKDTCSSFCRLNHNFLQADVHEILCKYGLDLGQLWKGGERVLNLLRSSIASFQGKNIIRSYKGGYIAAAIGTKVGEIEFGLGNKIETGNGNSDKIMANIQKIINSNQNIEAKGSENSDASSIGTEDMESTDTESTDGPHLKLNTTPKDVSDQGSGSDNRTTDIWFISTDNTKEEMVQAEMKVLEEKYQKFLEAKQVTLTRNGESFVVDFTTMEGWFTGSIERSSIQRIVVKEEVECESEMKDFGNAQDEDRNVSFENMKASDFIKI